VANESPASSLPWKKRQEIPDPQILEAAAQFEAARRLLDKQPPYTGILLPLMHSASMVIELSLKSLASELVYTPLENDACGSTVTAKPAVRRHRLIELFEVIDPILRDGLVSAYQKALERGLQDDLQHCEGLFEASRYPFEAKHDFARYEINVVCSLSSFLFRHVSSLEPTELIEWHSR